MACDSEKPAVTWAWNISYIPMLACSSGVIYGHVLPTTDDAITQALEAAFSDARGLTAACDESDTAT